MTVMDFQLGYSPADLTSPLIEYLDQVSTRRKRKDVYAKDGVYFCPLDAKEFYSWQRAFFLNRRPISLYCCPGGGGAGGGGWQRGASRDQ